jgi:hypothetical protein
MALIQCEYLGHGVWFDECTTQNGGWIIYKGYAIGRGCNDCQMAIQRKEAEKK